MLVNQNKSRNLSKHKLALSLAQLAFILNRCDQTNFNDICLVFLADSHLNHFTVLLYLGENNYWLLKVKSVFSVLFSWRNLMQCHLRLVLCH